MTVSKNLEVMLHGPGELPHVGIGIGVGLKVVGEVKRITYWSPRKSPSDRIALARGQAPRETSFLYEQISRKADTCTEGLLTQRGLQLILRYIPWPSILHGMPS